MAAKHIVTIGRQFGSGGRELGKRLADLLGWDYYDREIIRALADENGLHPDYVRQVLSTHGWGNYQLTYRHSFQQALSRGNSAGTELLLRQREILEEIAEAGNDCIIVGRDADVILQEYHPFRVYICADLSARLERCMAHEKKQPRALRLTEKEVLRNIRSIDKSRIRIREILTGKRHGDASGFDLTVNATHWNIKHLAPVIAEFAARWFEEQEVQTEEE
jgi:cytidylate kinase